LKRFTEKSNKESSVVSDSAARSG